MVHKCCCRGGCRRVAAGPAGPRARHAGAGGRGSWRGQLHTRDAQWSPAWPTFGRGSTDDTGRGGAEGRGGGGEESGGEEKGSKGGKGRKGKGWVGRSREGRGGGGKGRGVEKQTCDQRPTLHSEEATAVDLQTCSDQLSAHH